MSERQPNPEKKIQPIFDDCLKCEKRYQLTPENAGARHYPKQPECDYLLCQCPNCNYRTRIFVGPESMKDAVDNGLVVLDDEPYAEPEIYHGWLKVSGIELPKTYELTNRHEAIVRRFGETLLSAPDEHLYDLITDDGYGKPHPLKWID